MSSPPSTPSSCPPTYQALSQTALATSSAPSTPFQRMPASRAFRTAKAGDESALLKQQIYRPFLESIDDAFKSGWLLDWKKKNEQGKPYHPTLFNEAFKLFDIPMPCCLCETQENRATRRHFVCIWVVSSPELSYHGEVAMACHRRLCGFWKSLSSLYAHPDLVMTQYQRRDVPGPGIFGFDSYGTLEELPVLEGSPVRPPSSFVNTTRKGGFGAGKMKRRKTGKI
ncbi:hypothetical protein JB92DRAFT_1032395 [Gautieria morchelliformis]|nr:hypothetical protein JB92DRAFT_1032395 [Gautieria morchelliformis]